LSAADAIEPVGVLDTQLWLELLLFDDAATAGFAQRLAALRIAVAQSGATLAELRQVLWPARWPRAAWRQRAERLTALLAAGDAEALAALQAQLPFRLRLASDAPAPPQPRCRDASDQKFITLAAACDALALWTRDRALLKCRAFAHRHGKGPIITPQQWLARLEAPGP
jgi:predicted nucleic acid-binding protein